MDTLDRRARSTPKAKTPPSARQKTTKIGGWVSTDVVEKTRDLAHWDRKTLGELIEEALRLLIDHREAENNSQVPRRPRSRKRLRAGRPPTPKET